MSWPTTNQKISEKVHKKLQVNVKQKETPKGVHLSLYEIHFRYITSEAESDLTWS